MKCLNCGKEHTDKNGTHYCNACIEPHGKKYEPTPEQRKRMDEAMIKINRALSRVFKE